MTLPDAITPADKMIGRILTLEEVAAALNRSPKWLRRWLNDHPVDQYGSPLCMKLGRSYRFQPHDVTNLTRALYATDNKQRTFIYFIKAGKFIKIGRSRSWRKRMVGISTSTPHKIEVLLVLRGEDDQEGATHRQFERFRVKGEWFKDHPEIRSYIAYKKRYCVAHEWVAP